MKTIICPSCGKELSEDNVNYCPNCGFPITEDETASTNIAKKNDRINIDMYGRLLSALFFIAGVSAIYIGIDWGDAPWLMPHKKQMIITGVIAILFTFIPMYITACFNQFMNQNDCQ